MNDRYREGPNECANCGEWIGEFSVLCDECADEKDHAEAENWRTFNGRRDDDEEGGW